MIIARFSPDDPYQKERYECKKRYNLLPTQQPPLSLWNLLLRLLSSLFILRVQDKKMLSTQIEI